MKKPIDPNLQGFGDDLENVLNLSEAESFELNGETPKKEDKQNDNEMQIEVKKNHYSGASHHHHSSSGSSSHSSSHGSSHSSSSHGSSSHSHHHHSSSQSKKKKKKMPVAAKIALAIFIILLLLVFIVVGIVIYMQQQGKNDIKNVNTETDYQEVIEYKGHKYVYNDDMISLAFIGVDKRELGLKDGIVGTAGQADANIVLAIDSSTGKATAIAVPRDTMVEVDLYSESSVFLRSEEMQLCLSYAYGDGRASSAANVTTSISRILGNVPISKYFALDLDGIAPLNDAIGGVTVESLYDFNDQGIKKGDSVHLIGSMTETYVRRRDMDTVDASLNRTARQVQYIKAYAAQLIPAVINDFSIVSRMYNTAQQYSSTDITLSNATYLASLMLSKNITSFDTVTLQGEMKASDKKDYAEFVYAEFYPDEDALMETILNVFYMQMD